MDVGIVGAPRAGRTTTFRALLAHRAPASAGGRSAAAIGAIHVQDPRLDRLAAYYRPRKTTPVEIRIHDPCQSLEPSFPTAELEEMKRMDALALVVPAFGDPDPERAARAFESLLGELCLEDQALVERRLKTASRDRLPESVSEALETAQALLENEQPVRAGAFGEAQRAALRTYNLITDRALVCVVNVGEAQAAAPVPSALRGAAERRGMPALALCATLEAEMAELAPEERLDFLAEYGIREPASSSLTRTLLEGADLIPFFTVGEDECRAWAIPRGTTARRAAGKVHSDIERGFIRAEVVPAEELLELADGMAEAKRRGILRLEGKDYVVQDGDVVHFRFNV